MSAILAVHYHLQLVLKDCAHAGVRGCSFCRQLHSLQPQARKLPTSKDSKLTKSASPKTDEDKQLSSHSESTKDDAETDFKNSTSTELVPRSSSTGSLQRPTGASVPVRVFPKAKDRDGVLLSPIDRLRLESITRRPPPRIVKKPGEHNQETRHDVKSSLSVVCSIPGASADLPRRSGIHELHRFAAGCYHVSCFVRNLDSSSSILHT